jgi:hypothetical protein
MGEARQNNTIFDAIKSVWILPEYTCCFDNPEAILINFTIIGNLIFINSLT